MWIKTSRGGIPAFIYIFWRILIIYIRGIISTINFEIVIASLYSTVEAATKGYINKYSRLLSTSYIYPIFVHLNS
jgi:hypothetical protein